MEKLNNDCQFCQYMFSADGRLESTTNCSQCSKKSELNKYKGGNNTFFREGCPALMSDGRIFTYHNSSHELTEAMRALNGFRSPNQFRNFMQSNGELFMDTERRYQNANNRCRSRVACSEGYYDLWAKQCGDWTSTSGNFKYLNR